MAEWLRRLIRKQIGPSRASSNLADCVVFLSEHKLENTQQVQQMSKTFNCCDNHSRSDRAIMAVWLRRLIRNQMAPSRASSNLTDCVVFLGEHKIRKLKTSAADVPKH